MAELSSSASVLPDRIAEQTLTSLPGRYWHVLTRPTVGTFRVEKEGSRWGLAWFQMLALALVCALILTIASLIAPPDVSAMARASNLSVQTVQTTVTATVAILTFVSIPLTFLIATGVLYLLARVFGGKGTYLQQLSVTLLFAVPLVLLSTLLSQIPGVGNWLMWLPHIYSLVLMILALIAVHSRTQV